MGDVTDSRIAAATEHLAARFSEFKSPGLAAGIVHGDELIWSSGFGVADLKIGKAPDEWTVSRVASITKTFTGTAILQLRDEGLLNLDDPVTKYIPEFSEIRETEGNVKDVTLRRLMTHYSGLSTETALMSWGAEEFPQFNEILNALPDTEIVIPADSRWKYCNLAFGLMGEVIARVSGVEYVEYVKGNVIEPLGLESTAFDREDLPAEQLFTGYDAVVSEDPSRSELRVADYLHLNGITAAGQLHSNVADLGKWLSFQFREDGGERQGSQVLNGRTLAEMHQPQYVSPDWVSGQALVWRVERIDGRVYHGHGGAIHGFGSDICFNIPSRTGVVLLANAWPTSQVYEMSTEVMELLLTGDLPSTFTYMGLADPGVDVPPIETTPKHLEPYTGLFVAAPGIPTYVEFRGGDLWMTAPDGGFALHAPALLARTDEPNSFIHRGGGYGLGERAVFGTNGESFTLGGWLYKRVST